MGMYIVDKQVTEFTLNKTGSPNGTPCCVLYITLSECMDLNQYLLTSDSILVFKIYSTKYVE